MKHKPANRQDEPRPAEVSPEQLIAHLATLSQPASIREIAHGMGLKHHGRRFLPRIVQQLKKRGEIEEIHGGRYRLPGAKHAQRVVEGALPDRTAVAGQVSTPAAPAPKRARDPNLISGRIVAHRDGYGFVVPDEPMPRVAGDLFI